MVDELTVDELYELPKRMSALTWFAICRLVVFFDLPHKERGWGGARGDAGCTQEWEYEGQVFLEIGTLTSKALERRGLARERRDGCWEPTAKGRALVEGQGFRV